MAQSPESNLVAKCYRCDTPITEGTKACPNCGRNQFRTCYCGADIPVTARTCPDCGADWSGSYRLRRQARSRQLDWKRMAKFAVAGSLLALVTAGVLNAIITGLARHSLPSGQEIPASVIQRLGLALNSVWMTLETMGHRLAEIGGGLGTVTVVLVAGAGLGALAYLAREGFLRLRRQHRHPVKRRRSSRQSGSSSQR